MGDLKLKTYYTNSKMKGQIKTKETSLHKSDYLIQS